MISNDWNFIKIEKPNFKPLLDNSVIGGKKRLGKAPKKQDLCRWKFEQDAAAL